MAKGTKKLGAPKAAAVGINAANMFAAIEKMDGNPQSPTEFDDSPHDGDEVYFKADEEVSEVNKKKILILNFIHQELHYDTKRNFPAWNADDRLDVEIYHQAIYKGVELQVCVHWPTRIEGEFKPCFALVKLASDDMSPGHADADAIIAVDASWSKDAQADKFTIKVDTMTNNYWAPRWKYVVKSLRQTMALDYEKDGIAIIHPEPEPEVTANAAGGFVDDGTEIEEDFDVFAGCTGKIIGPKGVKIQEIRKAVPGLKDIKLPPKSEDGTRPRARELVQVKIIGTKTAVEKAKVLVQEIADEWKNAPRPPRDGGGGGGHGGGEAVTAADPTTDPGYQAPDLGGGGDWGGAPAAGGGGDTWADDANAQAASATAEGGDSSGGGGGAVANPW